MHAWAARRARPRASLGSTPLPLRRLPPVPPRPCAGHADDDIGLDATHQIPSSQPPRPHLCAVFPPPPPYAGPGGRQRGPAHPRHQAGGRVARPGGVQGGQPQDLQGGRGSSSRCAVHVGHRTAPSLPALGTGASDPFAAAACWSRSSRRLQAAVPAAPPAPRDARPSCQARVDRSQFHLDVATIHTRRPPRPQTFEAEVYALTKEEGGRHTPFTSKYKPQFFIRTADISGTDRAQGLGTDARGARLHGHQAGRGTRRMPRRRQEGPWSMHAHREVLLAFRPNGLSYVHFRWASHPFHLPRASCSGRTARCPPCSQRLPAPPSSQLLLLP